MLDSSELHCFSIFHGMVHSVSGWTRGVQVKLWSPLRTRATKRLRGVFTTSCYTNPRLPLPLPLPYKVVLRVVSENYLKNHALHAAFVVAKHDVVPMDLVAVDTASGKRLYSFLSIGWGLMSDVDIESEKYRSMGNARFTLMAIVKIASLYITLCYWCEWLSVMNYCRWDLA